MWEVRAPTGPKRPLAIDGSWPTPGFPLDRCKLTLAGGVIKPKVSFLTLARLSALGQQQSFGDVRFSDLQCYRRRQGTTSVEPASVVDALQHPAHDLP